MTIDQALALPRVRQNYLAIAAAAVANFLFEAFWYSYFIQAWMDGIGRTKEWFAATGMNFGVQCVVALASAALMAAAISCVTQLTGAQTALRGIRTGALLWLGFVFTTWATEYIFEVRGLKIFAINTGFWLLGMILMGAIVGGWKKK